MKTGIFIRGLEHSVEGIGDVSWVSSSGWLDCDSCVWKQVSVTQYPDNGYGFSFGKRRVWKSSLIVSSHTCFLTQ